MKKTDEELKKLLSKKRGDDLKSTCGVAVEESDCCGAPTEYTDGGVAVKICSKCKKEVHPKLIN